MPLHYKTIALISSVAFILFSGPDLNYAFAQTAAAPAPASAPAATPATPTAEAPVLMTADELQILVARIALYPDDLVALVLSASLNPLQIVQAERFIEQNKPNAKPDAAWDGSVVSLLNYPTVLKMMSDDLDWTQQLETAVVNQQKDVLVAIQDLRDKAVANGTIKSNDKVVVETKNDNVIIRPAKKEVTYVPTYDPVILTSPTYVAAAPIVYGDPYPSYYYPYAPYWAGFVTGVAFGAAVDWDNWHSWGGNDVNINVNNFNRDDFHFDRNNINNLNFDNSKFNFDRDSITNNLRENNANRLDLKNGGLQNLGAGGGLAGVGSRLQSSDVRRDVQNQLKQGGGNLAGKLQGQGGNLAGKLQGQAGSGNLAGKIQNQAGGGDLAGKLQNQAGNRNIGQNKGNVRANAQKAAGRVDNRPRQPSALGNYGPGRDARSASQRGNLSLGGGGGGQRIQGGGGGFQGGGGRFQGGGGGGFHGGGGGFHGGGGGFHGGGGRFHR